MQINTNITTLSFSNQIAANSICERVDETTELNNNDNRIPTESDAVVNGPDEDNNKEKGVIRLLREGHFKGVSDVRLRINFYDEISALEHDETVRVADEGVAKIADSFNTEVEVFLQSEELDEQLSDVISESQSNFSTNISQILDDYSSESALDNDKLISQLQSTFNEFVSTVEMALDEPAEPVVEPSPENIIQTSAEAGSTIDIPAADIVVKEELPNELPQAILEQFLANLIETFTTGLNELEIALSRVKVLPEISRPHGHGRAYEKFLTAYNELRGIGETESLLSSIDTTT